MLRKLYNINREGKNLLKVKKKYINEQYFKYLAYYN